MTVGKFGISAISPVLVIGLLFSLASLPQARAHALPALVNEVLETHPSLLVQRSLGQVSEKAVEAAPWQYFPTPSVSTEAAGTSRLIRPGFAPGAIPLLRKILQALVAR